jgi:hypothetical protein
MMREVRDKVSVEIDEADEGLYLLFVGGCQPVCYSSNLHWVHFHLVMRDDDAEVLNLGPFKLTFLQSEVELMLVHTV